MADYEEEIDLAEGSFGKDVNLQAQDEDGQGINLTGCTVYWIVYDPETRSKTTPVYVLKATCTAVDLSDGKVKYTLKETDWVCHSPAVPTGYLEGDTTYESVLLATKTGYQEEFLGLEVKIKEQAPTTS